MRTLGLFALAAVLLAGFASRVLAGAFEDGLAAYDRGDYATALETFRSLSAKGDASATYNVGVMFFNGHGVAQDTEQAIVWLEQAADQGSLESQVELGIIYVLGRGVPKDYSRALKLFEKAAYQGAPLGQFYLGRLYELGLGTEKNLHSARGWYRVAASQGEPMAEKRLRELARNTETGRAHEAAPEETGRDELGPASPIESGIEVYLSARKEAAENEATPGADAVAATVGDGGGDPAAPAYRVHLASFRSPDEVDEGWRSLRKQQDDLLAGLDATSERVDLGAEKGVYYRLLAGPLPSRTAARQLCQRLKQESPETWCNPVKVPAE